MSANFPIEYNTRHIEAFLQKIARYRDFELQQINKQVDEEVRKIRQEAHGQARRLARRVIGETRERERRQRDRYLYKLHSELTRERWGILTQTRERVFQDLLGRFEHAWADPDRQCDWCRFWIESAMAMATPNDLRIRCGAGTLHTTLEKMQQLSGGYAGHCEWQVDAAKPPGLIVEWPDHYLDGTLDRQCEVVAEAVLSRVVEILDKDEPSETSNHE
jgi:vacuolar-type H+-ATPase subunit E/Vma4